MARNLHDARASTDEHEHYSSMVWQKWIHLKGDNQGFSKHAPKMQAEYSGLQVSSMMARKNDFQTRSLQTAWGKPLCHSTPPGVLRATRSAEEQPLSECRKITKNCGPYLSGPSI